MERKKSTRRYRRGAPAPAGTIHTRAAIQSQRSQQTWSHTSSTWWSSIGKHDRLSTDLRLDAHSSTSGCPLTYFSRRTTHPPYEQASPRLLLVFFLCRFLSSGQHPEECKRLPSIVKIRRTRLPQDTAAVASTRLIGHGRRRLPAASLRLELGSRCRRRCRCAPINLTLYDDTLYSSHQWSRPLWPFFPLPAPSSSYRRQPHSPKHSRTVRLPWSSSLAHWG